MKKVEAKVEYLKGLVDGAALRGAEKDAVIAGIIDALDLIAAELDELSTKGKTSAYPLDFLEKTQNASALSDLSNINHIPNEASDYQAGAFSYTYGGRAPSGHADLWYDDSVNVQQRPKTPLYDDKQTIRMERICRHCGTYVYAEFSPEERDRVRIQCPKCKHFLLPEDVNGKVLANAGEDKSDESLENEYAETKSITDFEYDTIPEKLIFETKTDFNKPIEPEENTNTDSAIIEKGAKKALIFSWDDESDNVENDSSVFLEDSVLFDDLLDSNDLPDSSSKPVLEDSGFELDTASLERDETNEDEYLAQDVGLTDNNALEHSLSDSLRESSLDYSDDDIKPTDEEKAEKLDAVSDWNAFENDNSWTISKADKTSGASTVVSEFANANLESKTGFENAAFNDGPFTESRTSLNADIELQKDTDALNIENAREDKMQEGSDNNVDNSIGSDAKNDEEQSDADGGGKELDLKVENVESTQAKDEIKQGKISQSVVKNFDFLDYTKRLFKNKRD